MATTSDQKAYLEERDRGGASSAGRLDSTVGGVVEGEADAGADKQVLSGLPFTNMPSNV